jgi:adenylate cyclase
MRDDPPKLRATSSMTMTRVPRPRAAKTQRVTVLFADLRGYTGLAERLPPASVMPLLDEFLGVLGRATTQHGGQIFHMAGDGMMAGFGVGDPAGDGAREALAAGHAMLLEFGAVAARWRREILIETGIGVGLHLGEVALGSLGPPGRRRTTLVGDTVNVASRLCGRARAGEVLLSCTVAAALDAERVQKGFEAMPAAILQLPQFELRGRSEPLDIWCIPASERAAL